jgi:hypothetical protein
LLPKPQHHILHLSGSSIGRDPASARTVAPIHSVKPSSLGPSNPKLHGGQAGLELASDCTHRSPSPNGSHHFSSLPLFAFFVSWRLPYTCFPTTITDIADQGMLTH